MEASHPDLITADSPTQRVGAEPQSVFPNTEHTVPMWSLDSTQDPAEVRRFDERVRKGLEDEPRYVLEPKLDGASIELVYEEGLFVRGVTRGNGRVGEGRHRKSKNHSESSLATSAKPSGPRRSSCPFGGK